MVSLFLTLSLTLCILVSLLLTLNIFLILRNVKNVGIRALYWKKIEQKSFNSFFCFLFLLTVLTVLKVLTYIIFKLKNCKEEYIGEAGEGKTKLRAKR